MKTAKKQVTEISRKPDFSGVPGEFVKIEDAPGLYFGNRLRGSPYDALLDKLAEAKGMYLKFGDQRARASILVRAKKKGMKVSIALQGTQLFVRFDGRIEDDTKAARRKDILGALKFGPATAMKVTNVLRGKGDEAIDLPLVERILEQMARTGDVIKQEGGSWALNPSKPRAA